MENIFKRLLEFRSLMGLGISKEDVRRIWGKRIFKSLSKEELGELNEISNIHVLRKLNVATNQLSSLMVFDWVKFIGVSGSVAAGFTKEEDDIDLFIVVKNHTMWLYRGILALRNIFERNIRTNWNTDVKDKLCLNLICEERGLTFDSDIFNFHELMYLKPLYKEEYLKHILLQNDWLFKEFSVTKITTREQRVKKQRFVFLYQIANFIAFWLQFFFMLVFRHRPNLRRLRSNNKLGKIEFFEERYREKILKNYLKEFKSIN